LDEGHLLAKHQVSEILTNSTNFYIFSDGTCRDGKQVMDIGVHTPNPTLVLGFKPVAKEDSNTVAKVIQDSLNESASLENISVNKLVLQITSMMSDRSSVMKKTNEIFDEWRQDLDESDISALNCFYCSGHVLLGFHNEITKTLKISISIIHQWEETLCQSFFQI
jgi:hypothetical protein